MHPAKLPRTAILACLLSAICLFAEDASRLAQVTEELTTLQALIEKLPEGARERRKLEERRDFLNREREILEKRAAIDARQTDLSRRQYQTAGARLRQDLQNLEPLPPAQARIEAANQRLRDAVARRESLREERKRLAGRADAAARLGPLDEQLLTLDEEIEALQLQREAADLGRQLQETAHAIGERVGAASPNPPLHLSAWWEARSDLRRRAQLLAEAGDVNLAVGERLGRAAESLELAREKAARIDEQIALLAGQTGLFRNTQGVDRLLAAARRDKEAMTARLPFHEAQFAALDEAHRHATARVALLRTELDWLAERQTEYTDRLVRWLAWPAGVGAVLVVLFLGISRLILPHFYKQEMLVSARRVNRYLLAAALAAMLALFFFEDLRVLATTLGIVSAALVIALQDVFTSLAGWFALIASRKIRLGDRIEVDGVKGDVLEIELLRTTLVEIGGDLGIDEPTGRIVALPNSFIFKSRVHNATHGHRWTWMRSDITVTYETPLAEAAAVLQRATVEETAAAFEQARQDSASILHRYGRVDANYQPRIYHTIADSGVTFTLLFVADAYDRPAMRDRLHRRILADFARDPRLQFAYPTQREIQSQEPPPATPPAPVPVQLTAWPQPPAAKSG